MWKIGVFGILLLSSCSSQDQAASSSSSEAMPPTTDITTLVEEPPSKPISEQESLTIAEFRKSLELFGEGKHFATVSFSKGQSIDTLIKIGGLTGNESPLSKKGIVNGLHDTIQELRKASNELEYLLLFLDKTQSITSVQQKLGDESRRKPGGFFIPSTSHIASSIENNKGENSKPLMWHTYGWVDFGVVDSKVVALRIDLREYPSDDRK